LDRLALPGLIGAVGAEAEQGLKDLQGVALGSQYAATDASIVTRKNVRMGFLADPVKVEEH
jgi:hypothetical protein